MTSETITLLDPSRPSWATTTERRPVRAHIWGTRTPGPAPVVLLSHGTGGAAESLEWLASAFHDAGFLVAAVDHHGNNYIGEYLIEGFAFVWERPRDLSLLLDHLVANHDVDPDRIGAVGFSLGGYTVAALLGARVDAQILQAVFTGTVAAPHVPEFPGLIAQLRSTYGQAELAAICEEGSMPMTDTRVRAGILLAPAAASLLDSASLIQIEAPVLVRWGDSDDNTPPGANAHVYRDLIPRASGASVGADVGHYVFIGSEADPNDVRPRVATDSVRFLREALT